MNALMQFIISPAYADTPAVSAAGTESGSFSIIIMFAVIFAFMYFAVWRPQSKRAKEHQQLMSSLNKGDEIITSAGVLGRISKLTNQYIVVTVANNVDVIMQKSAIVNVLPKGTLKSLE